MQGNHINRASFLRNKHKRMKTKKCMQHPRFVCVFSKIYSTDGRTEHFGESYSLHKHTLQQKKYCEKREGFRISSRCVPKVDMEKKQCGGKTGTWWGNNYCGEVKQVKQFIWSIFIFCKQWVLKWKQNKNKSKRKQNYCVLLNGQEKKWY